MFPGRLANRALWHRKAKWMLRKVILNPPTSQGQMRNLCNEIVERRHGSNSPPTAAIISTALSLWDDPKLVGALQSNPTYMSARERIHRTASHILPANPSSFEISSKNLLPLYSAQEVMERQFQEVLQCPTCGVQLHCHHDHKTTSVESKLQSKFQLEEDVDEFVKFSEGTIGNVPKTIEEIPVVTATPITPVSKTEQPIDWDIWFGPLVLTTFAVFGIAVGIWSGEIVLPKVKSATSRAILAVSMMMKASNSLVKLLDPQL